MPRYNGSCHCGAVTVAVNRAEPIDRLIDCNCSICSKKGILHVPVEDDEFELLSGEPALSLYQFRSQTARHWFCRHCVIHLFNRPRNHPHRYSVNARCLDEFETIRDEAHIVAFDGQNHPKDNV